MKTSFIPREHGATAMLLVPFFSAAVLARQIRWAEGTALIAVLCAFATKDPLVALARQRWIWKQPHPETAVARTWLTAEALILVVCGLLLAASWPLWALAATGAGAVAFSALAVAVNVKNRQRSTLFQIVSAIALTSTSVTACLSATGAIQDWCWWLWTLCALQASAGILVVHARLEERIAMRKHINSVWRCRALVAATVLLCASGAAALARQPWIAAALAVAGIGYLYELHRQKDAASLQLPLTQVGLQALSLSIAYALMVVGGLR